MVFARAAVAVGRTVGTHLPQVPVEHFGGDVFERDRSDLLLEQSHRRGELILVAGATVGVV